MIVEIGIGLIGIVVFFLGFVIPEKYTNKAESLDNMQYSGGIQKIIEDELNQVKSKVDDVLENTIDEVAEQTEKSLEKITNEKIMAVNEYADGVLNEIQKTYSEVMFLYSMLNDKEKELKDFVLEQMSPVTGTEKSESVINKVKQDDPVEDKSTENPHNQASGIYARKKKMEKYDIRNHNNVILSLNNEGKNDIEIAKQLGLGVGEVRLVLDLFKGAKE